MAKRREGFWLKRPILTSALHSFLYRYPIMIRFFDKKVV
jgi:hypothetical protein